MVILNLLSHEKKEELKFRKIYSIGKDFTFVIFIFAILISIMLSIANIILVNTFNNTVSNSYLLGNSDHSFKKELNEVNKTLAGIKKIQSGFKEYDDLLLEITGYMPKNVSLSYLSIDSLSNKVSFKGHALLRENLLELKNNLENSDIFKNIESPVANLLEKENINFTITADLAVD